MKMDFGFLIEYVENLQAEKRQEITLYDGINMRSMKNLEKDLGFVIPNELKSLYKISYGAIFDEFKILRIPEIDELIKEIKITYQETYRNTIIPFAYLVGVGDFISLDSTVEKDGKLLILDCFHELPANEWSPICYGLDTWVKKIIDNDFQPFWLK